PQNLNFDLIGGVNFKKGCYIGQEIVARLHWKGQAKNRALRFVCELLSLQPGQTLHAADGRALGEIIECAVNENNELEFLLNVRLDAAQDKLPIQTDPATDIRLLTLPYAIPSTEAAHSQE
ncbi:MAG TPA: tRNA-modifying protein YgfZ, partial [Pseudomonadales bacterium]|nr:tRNA-modifying protein YgfZ [Pseudomonadales bacterium]